MKELHQRIASGSWNEHVRAVWIDSGKYVLYTVNADAFEELASEMDTITSRFSSFISSPNAHKKTKDYREMTSLDWVKIERISDEGFKKKAFSPWAQAAFSKKDLKNWATELSEETQLSMSDANIHLFMV
jgi:hypothetical protein